MSVTSAKRQKYVIDVRRWWKPFSCTDCGFRYSESKSSYDCVQRVVERDLASVCGRYLPMEL